MTASPYISVKDRALYGQAAPLIVAARQGLAWEEDAEFSDLGRSPRLLPGWWLLPGLLLGLAFWAWVLHAVVSHAIPGAAHDAHAAGMAAEAL